MSTTRTVSGEESTYPIVTISPGIPLKLELMSRAMQALGPPTFYYGTKDSEDSLKDYASRCSQIADALIAEYNKGLI